MPEHVLWPISDSDRLDISGLQETLVAIAEHDPRRVPRRIAVLSEEEQDDGSIIVTYEFEDDDA